MTLELKINALDFIPGALVHMTQICADQQATKLQLSKLSSSSAKEKQIALAFLGKGMWYANDYCAELEKFGQSKRLVYLVSNGHTYHGLVPKMLTLVEDENLPTGKKLCVFKVAPGVLPSDALDSFNDSLSVVDCRTTMDIAIYRSLRDFLGKEKFNVLFASDSSTPLQIGGAERTPLYKKFFQNVALQSSGGLQPGDICYFSNTNLYMPKHPFGHGRGYNTLCKGIMQKTPRFIAFGLEPEGHDAMGIEQALVNEHNLPQKLNYVNEKVRLHTYGKTLLANVSRSQELVAKYASSQLTHSEFLSAPVLNSLRHEKTEGKMLLNVDRPDLVRIQKLADASLDTVRALFDQF